MYLLWYIFIGCEFAIPFMPVRAVSQWLLGVCKAPIDLSVHHCIGVACDAMCKVPMIQNALRPCRYLLFLLLPPKAATKREERAGGQRREDWIAWPQQGGTACIHQTQQVQVLGYPSSCFPGVDRRGARGSIYVAISYNMTFHTGMTQTCPFRLSIVDP